MRQIQQKCHDASGLSALLPIVRVVGPAGQSLCKLTTNKEFACHSDVSVFWCLCVMTSVYVDGVVTKATRSLSSRTSKEPITFRYRLPRRSPKVKALEGKISDDIA